MLIFRDFDSLEQPLPCAIGAGSCVTIGNFDGIHRAHQALLQRTHDAAQEYLAVAVTFDPHPLEVLTPHAPPRLTTTATRLAILEKYMDLVVCVKFTREIAAMTPEDFVQNFLLNTLHMKELFLGYDFCLGKNRSGTPERLAEIGKEKGFRVEILQAIARHGGIISSTRIREAIALGNVEEVSALLGRYHSVQGKVIHGQERGRLLGFPTANLSKSEVLLPKPGVYATLATLPDQKKTWQAVTNIGHNPTFGESALSVETHLMGFSGDIYDHDLEIAFVSRLREEKKFSSPKELADQIAEDRQQSKKILANVLI